MREALNRKFGGAPSNPTPVTKENNKPLESMNSDNSKPVITTAPSSNARNILYLNFLKKAKLNMNKMIEQMEKSYMSGATDSKEEPKPFTNNKIIPVENKTIAIKAPVAPIKGNAPKIPGVPLPPPLTIPLPPKIVINMIKYNL